MLRIIVHTSIMLDEISTGNLYPYGHYYLIWGTKCIEKAMYKYVQLFCLEK
jgi:hypothetical protein